MTLDLTYKNYFKFGFNQIPYSRRQAKSDVWFAEFGPAERPPGTFREECIETAKIIRSQTTQDLWLLFSGGIDSEVMLRAFVAADIPVHVAINRFAQDLNLHDISYAIAACEELSVPYRFFELDIVDFWKNKNVRYLTMSDCCWPRLTPTMWLMEQVPGYPVLGSGECFLKKVVPEGYIPGTSPYEPSDWLLYEREKISSWYRFLIAIKKPGCAGFFQYTPEIVLSYLRDPVVKALCSNEIIGKLSTRTSKHSIYNRHFPIRERRKYTGFEKVAELDKLYQAEARALFPYHDEVCTMTYDHVVHCLERNL